MPEPKTILILPTYHEAGNLETLVPAVLAATGSGVEVLVIDDNSRDGSEELIRRIGDETGRASIIVRARKEGLGAAYRAGMKAALALGAEYAGTMDADWSHDPKYLPAMLDARSRGDLVIGSRYISDGRISQWPLWRRTLSKSARLAARTVLGGFCQDFTSGFRIYSRRALETVPPDAIESDTYSFLMEYAVRIHRAGLSITEVPIEFVDRRNGYSKLPSTEIFRAIETLVRLKLG